MLYFTVTPIGQERGAAYALLRYAYQHEYNAPLPPLAVDGNGKPCFADGGATNVSTRRQSVHSNGKQCPTDDSNGNASHTDNCGGNACRSDNREGSCLQADKGGGTQSRADTDGNLCAANAGEGTEGKKIYFSLSHTAGAAAVALHSAAVGIDCERARTFSKAAQRRIFNVVECDIVDAADNQDLAALRLWTQKESGLKCRGHGITTLAALRNAPTEGAFFWLAPFGVAVTAEIPPVGGWRLGVVEFGQLTMSNIQLTIDN